MPADRGITLHVPHDCINQTRRTPQNCPMAQTVFRFDAHGAVQPASFTATAHTRS